MPAKDRSDLWQQGWHRLALQGELQQEGEVVEGAVVPDEVPEVLPGVPGQQGPAEHADHRQGGGEGPAGVLRLTDPSSGNWSHSSSAIFPGREFSTMTRQETLVEVIAVQLLSAPCSAVVLCETLQACASNLV